jgi:serine O-acetyltransferase
MVGLPETMSELRNTLGADFRRNASAGQRLTLTIFRVGQFCHTSTSALARVLRPWWRLADVFYLRTLLHAELPPRFSCGPGLALPHAGRGVVIHENTSLGENSMVFHRVTVGAAEGEAPSIGANVAIGTGACLLGPIVVGDHVRIGANAVVVKDVAPWTNVGGVPATVLRIRDEDRARHAATHAASKHL